jgi:hypothetical protein
MVFEDIQASIVDLMVLIDVVKQFVQLETIFTVK